MLGEQYCELMVGTYLKEYDTGFVLAVAIE